MIWISKNHKVSAVGLFCTMRVVSRFRYERKQRPARVLQYLLFAHVFIGSDTASTIHKFGKPLSFKEVSILHCPKKRCWHFLRRQSPGNIGNWHCFLTLSINQYIVSLWSQKKEIERLINFFFHHLQELVFPTVWVYHQLKVWQHLLNKEKEPLKWGC